MFWRRKKSKVPATAARDKNAGRAKEAPPNAKTDSSSELVTLTEDFTVEMNIRTVDDAKQAIKWLKQEKKQLGLWKKRVATDKRQLKLQHRTENAQRGPAMRGGGGVGKFVRAMQASEKHNARNQQLTELSPLEREQAAIDKLSLNIESAILQAERYLNDHANG